MQRTSARKLMYRPKVGILRAKWLEKLKQKKSFKTTTKFIERNIGKCYKTVVK